MSDTIFRSSKRRIFVSEAIEENAPHLLLDESNAHYLCRVLRLREGTLVDVADGSGRLWQGALQQSDGAWMLDALSVIHEEAPGVERVLVAALIKSDRWEWMIEKAAELGVHRIVPLRADRSVVELEGKREAQRIERWSKIAESAARQCERLAAVYVEAPVTLAQALSRFAADQRLMLDETVPRRPWPPLQKEQRIVLFIGPEGGWSEKEQALLQQAGVERCGLGSNLLRAETAALAALTLVRALEEELI